MRLISAHSALTALLWFDSVPAVVHWLACLCATFVGPGKQCKQDWAAKAWHLHCSGCCVVLRDICMLHSLRCRQQQLTKQQQLVQEWQGFAARQAQRYVPAPPNPSRRQRLLQDSACYRLRLLHVDNLPAPHQSSGVKYGLQLGVTLFDEAVGQHYGSTCYSLIEHLQGQEERQTDADAAVVSSSEPSVDFSFDVFFHSAISDAHCMAVVSQRL